MHDPLREMLHELASRFRFAILRSNPATSSLATLREFPRGACGDASLLLAKYLQVQGCGESLLVVGKRRGHSHAWLRLQDLTVDITADQFDDANAGVIVERESPWHASFHGEIHNVADFCLYDRHSVFQLTRAYEAIVGCLE